MLLDERYILQDSTQLRDYYAAPIPACCINRLII